jgi:hypothetical protein
MVRKIPARAISSDTCWKPFTYASCPCIEFCQVLLTLIEKFIMLLRSRSCTHHLHMLLLYWKYAKTCLSFLSNRYSMLHMWSPFLMFLQKRHGLCKSMKKIWTHEGPSEKRKKWAHEGSGIEKRSHVLKIKVRERSFMLRSILKVYHLFHTHAHIDLWVWHFSPWIQDLTLQYMQCKYAFISFPTRAWHKLLKVGRERHCCDVPWWEFIHHWVIQEYHLRSTCDLCFYSKKLQKLQVTKMQK